MVHFGSGPPLVLVPGIQGRWEWMEPAVRALADRFTVATASLPGDAGSPIGGERGQGLDVQASLIEHLLDECGWPQALIVGVSFGGVVASYFAARQPDRVSALVLVSAPGPDWRPDRRATRYMRSPLLMAPVFVACTPARIGREIWTALPTMARRVGFVGEQAIRVMRAPMRPALMGARLRLLASVRSADWCGGITAPTLVITGDQALDRVVPVTGTRRYRDAIVGARVAELPRTGHIGCVTQPHAFARLVREFWDALDAGGDPACVAAAEGRESEEQR